MRFELMTFSFGGRHSNPLSYEARRKEFTRSGKSMSSKSVYR